MKITKVSATFVRLPLGAEFRPTWNTGVVQKSIASILVRVETDEGRIGIGAGPCSGTASAALIEDQFTQLIVGLDPFRIEEIARLVRPIANEYAWPWCVEMALWDLMGKATNQPVYRLLGRYNTEMRAYASLGERRDLETRLGDVERLTGEGFTAIKLRFRGDAIQEDIAIVAGLRDAYPDLTIMVDANMGHAMPGSARMLIWDLKRHSAWPMRLPSWMWRGSRSRCRDGSSASFPN